MERSLLPLRLPGNRRCPPLGEKLQRYLFPVSVLIERREVARAGWSVPHWDLVGVVGGQPEAARPGPRLVQDDPDCRRILWGGLEVELFADESETYWHNLTAAEPLIFVICRELEDRTPAFEGAEMRPELVSVSGDDASAHTEADDLVLSAPMPAEIYRWVEEFVVEHFRPAPRKVRKRKNWTEDQGD